MLDRMDWDTYWRFELFRRKCDPLDFRAWKRDSQRELKTMYPGRPLLLDSTAGLGDHTVNLAEEGFEVEACDVSEIALQATRRAVTEAKLDVPVFRARWEALERPGRYDLIFNDALHWTYEPDDLRAALRGFYEALAPGGALVFFFADRAEPAGGAGRAMLDDEWAHTQRARIAWDHTHEGTTVTLTVLAERGEDFIDEHHLYLVRERESAPRLETLTMRRVYRWDWHALAPLLSEVGYVDLRTDHFQNVKGYWYAMSRAFRPR